MQKVVSLFILVLFSAAAFGGLWADLDGDGRVDFADLAILAEEWLMSEPPSAVQITGNLAPDATGKYAYAGEYNGLPYYVRTDSNWFIWYCEPLENDVITNVLGSGLDDPHWRREIEDPMDQYSPAHGAVGIAVVEMAKAKRVFVIEQDQPVEAFSRDSIAFLDGVPVAEDVARDKRVLLVGANDGEVVKAGGPSGANTYPQCLAGGVLYGIEGNQAGRTNKSTDGETWVRTASATSLTGMWETPAGFLMGWDNPTKKIYRSIDQADTWTEVTPTGDNALSAGAVISGRWTIAKKGNLMLMAEYGAAERFGGRYIFKSTDDGVTWLRCFDAADITATEANQIMHFHGVAYHAATGRWIAVAGDTFARRCNVYSDDDGVTWHVLNAPNTYFTQPLGGFVDYGDPHYLMCGDDGYSSIQLFDVRDGSLINLYSGFIRATGNVYVFDLIQHGGVFYAMKATTTAGIYDMSILVSADGVDWSPYYYFPLSDKISSVMFAGFLNGKLHFRASSMDDAINYQFKISLAKVSMVDATIIAPAVTNLLSANHSSLETNVTSWVRNAGPIWTSFARDDEEALHGDYSGKLVRQANAAAGSLELMSDTTLVAGKTYIWSAMVKGTNTLISPRCRYRTAAGGGGARSDASHTFLVDKRWKRVFSNPFTVQEGEEEFYRVQLALLACTLAEEIYVDCVQLHECPVTFWQLGGTEQSADVLTETVTPGKVWTDIFAVRAPWVHQWHVADAQLKIKTWALESDPTNKIDLVYDPADAKFKIIRTVAGAAQTAVESAATYWHGNTCIKFVLRVSGAAVNLDIQNGRAVETLTDGGMAALLDAEIVGTYGDFPMVVLTGWNLAQFVPLWISDADIDRVFNLETPSYGVF